MKIVGPFILLSLVALSGHAQRTSSRTDNSSEVISAAGPRVVAPTAPFQVAGVWTGQLAIPGKSLTIGLAISSARGQVVAMLETPGSPLDRHAMTLTMAHDTLRFYDRLTDARYECQRSDDGTLLIGQWGQPGFRELLVLRHEEPVPATPARRILARASRPENGSL